jgi:hypothetical protein
MVCCPECFGDRFLRKDIFPLRSTAHGTCTYCASGNLPVLAPEELAEYFVPLINAYRQEAGGRLLVQLFRDDWGIFQHPNMDDSRAKDLLGEILDDGDIVRQPFVPAKDIPTEQLTKWETLRDELMYRNRFFPQVDIDEERLSDLLGDLQLSEDEIPNLWFRARIQSSDRMFPLDEMGAPPKRIASHGRANPAGIPYLYLGSTHTTAISEIRPHTGELACVASFRTTPADLKLVDLRQPRKTASPFTYGDPDTILKLRADLPFLERLGDELTRPVLPQSAAIDYTPSQYLCEFIKKCGYHGVVYRSSVSDGINLALFEPSLARIESVAQYRVDRVSVEVAAT